ncbi:MAG: 30S ribosomal protein S8 [Planctomycetia bacterium]|nr:MAG: 30S ribosomal protein S8 [Planctomycetia bacterium]
MATSDTIADMLTRIRNATRVRKPTVRVKRSGVCVGILGVLKSEGYINGFVELSDTNQGEIDVELKYGDRGEMVLQGLERTSKPGCRRYTGYEGLPRVLDGLGIWVLSTSRGVMSDRDCRKNKIGGEMLCKVW